MLSRTNAYTNTENGWIETEHLKHNVHIFLQTRYETRFDSYDNLYIEKERDGKQ